jgi:hypothetical protein
MLAHERTKGIYFLRRPEPSFIVNFSFLQAFFRRSLLPDANIDTRVCSLPMGCALPGDSHRYAAEGRGLVDSCRRRASSNK